MVQQTGRIELTVVGGADEVGLLAERELGNALVPALDDSANALDSQRQISQNCERMLTIWVTKGDPRSRDESNLEPSRRVPTSSWSQPGVYRQSTVRSQCMETVSPFLGKFLPSPGEIVCSVSSAFCVL